MPKVICTRVKWNIMSLSLETDRMGMTFGTELIIVVSSLRRSTVTVIFCLMMADFADIS
jgi:hypothetical protein